MLWWQYALLGAAGGALVEVLAIFRAITIWQTSRRVSAGAAVKDDPPGWRQYVDVPVHVWLLFIRGPLGASTAMLFGLTGQISGAYAAVAFGFAAPAILAQLGSVPLVADVVKPDIPTAANASETEVGAEGAAGFSSVERGGAA